MSDNERVAAKAWNETKLEQDPEWSLIRNEGFKEKLRFAADRVIATGTAQTNFEVKVKEINQAELEAKKDEGALAVSEPEAGLDASGAMSKSEVKEKAPSKKEVKEAKDKVAKDKEILKKTDKSGHVPTGKEAEAEAKEQEKAPVHP